MIDWREHDGVLELALGHGPLNEIGTTVLEGLDRGVRQAVTPVPAPSSTINQSSTTFAPSASFGPNYFDGTIGRAEFDARADDWFRRSMRQ